MINADGCGPCRCSARSRSRLHGRLPTCAAASCVHRRPRFRCSATGRTARGTSRRPLPATIAGSRPTRATRRTRTASPALAAPSAKTSIVISLQPSMTTEQRFRQTTRPGHRGGRRRNLAGTVRFELFVNSATCANAAVYDETFNIVTQGTGTALSRTCRVTTRPNTSPPVPRSPGVSTSYEHQRGPHERQRRVQRRELEHHDQQRRDLQHPVGDHGSRNEQREAPAFAGASLFA